MKSVVIVSLLCFLSKRTSSQTPFWQRTNGPFGRLILSLSATSNGTVLAAPHHADNLASKGIYRTTG